jgi:hypothetical protein
VKSFAAIAFALLLACAACGTSDVKSETFRKALEERTELTKAEVGCVVDETYKTFDQDQINDLYTASDRKDLPNGDETRFEKIVQGCVHK